ncbi:phosphatase PAP2 family protein [Aneurinibacillus sp. Ricciae_BoGa-3]|uniref:phosphatase PAP2 family protein n=1 Tax=Aneurinibacillus sp. Ricciae_BoGa-3 TaxID=3022697 RepID=UPI00234272F7|nr:phosphatase PAP2 family protein [Aneurinibacillus sp. Ricciae_BoGa-3]WCK56460.1 phosphatase PAP2 family protein [Aneurinibacillus sp. Ricciae_BoGa-3]
MDKPGLKFTPVFIYSLSAVACFVWMAVWISTKQITRFDNAIIALVQGYESPALTFIMKFFTFIGSTPCVAVLAILVMVFLYKVLHHRMELIVFLVVVVGTPLLNVLLKSLFRRQRPTIHRLIEQAGYSFPSGHSMEAFAFYGVLTFLLWRHIPTRPGRTLLLIFSALMILAIGVSRIYLGVHYPSDVLGGYFVSAFWLGLTIWIFQWYQERRQK